VRNIYIHQPKKRKALIIMNNKQDKGFTLVELLIVIVILGILATVTVFAVRGITDKGQKNACDVEKRTLDTAIESYYAINQKDPTAIGDLTNGTNALLKTNPAANWTFVTGTPASFTAVTKANGGKCA
jgi:prepilin-type N-terminal cleavage/methylation domain-containing protein